MPTAIVNRKNVSTGAGMKTKQVPIGTRIEFEGELPAYLVGKCRIESDDELEVATPDAGVSDVYTLSDGTEMTEEDLRANYAEIVGDPGKKLPKTLLKELEKALAQDQE